MLMSFIRFVILTISFLCFSSHVNAEVGKRILILNSYSADNQWSNSIIDNIGVVVKSRFPDVELTVEYLSTERFTNASVWVDRANLLFDSYANQKLSAVVVISDEAWMAYRAIENDSLFKDVPLFLCAVKTHSITIEKYFKDFDNLMLSNFEHTEDVMKRYNATGVLREMNVNGYFDLMHDVLPKLDSYTIITDSRFHGIYTKLMIQNYLCKSRSQLPIEYLSSQNMNTDSLLEVLPSISPNSGVLLTSWLTGEAGYEYSKAYVYKQMYNSLKSPIFITNDIGITTNNFIGGYYNESSFWGKLVADMIVETFEGGSYSSIAPQTYKDEQCNINWEVLSEFGISTDNLPKTTNYVNRPESIFVKYSRQFIVGGVFLSLLIFLNIYMIKSNIELKKAHKLTAQAVNESNLANKHLIETQERLKMALEKAKDADRLKSAFISNMDHEIRTPLNLIVGFSSIISTMNDRAEIETAANQISENSEKLLKLIRDILDLSQLESGTVGLVYDRVDINGMFEDLIPHFKNDLKSGVTIKCVMPDKPITIITERFRVSQVLSNMIDNAIKFTEKGVVEVGYFAFDDTWVEFYVNDSGIGIKESELNMVFDRFFKSDSYSKGSGIGLSVSKTIINILDGTIGVTSKLGVGSRFWFRIKNS